MIGAAQAQNPVLQDRLTIEVIPVPAFAIRSDRNFRRSSMSNRQRHDCAANSQFAHWPGHSAHSPGQRSTAQEKPGLLSG